MMSFLHFTNDKEIALDKHQAQAAEELQLEIFWASNTEEAYRADWADFLKWCISQEKEPMPATAGTVGAYLLELRGKRLKASTIRRRAVAIGRVQDSQGHENPTKNRYVEDIVRGVHREQQYVPEKKTPIPPDDLAAMVRALEDDCKAKLIRDRAILLVGWATGFRRSELASLTVGDLEWTDDGVVVRLRRVNRYQQKDPDVCHIDFLEKEELCPVRALRTWLDTACITGGPLFVRIDRWKNIWSEGLTGKSLTRVVKKAAEAAGFEPANYSSQSFRRNEPQDD